MKDQASMTGLWKIALKNEGNEAQKISLSE